MGEYTFPARLEDTIREKGTFEIVTTIVFILITLSVGIISFVITTLNFKEKTFPSFLVYPNGVISLTKKEQWKGISAGLKPLDVVKEINGRKITSGTEIYRIARTLPHFEVKVLRNGKSHTYHVYTSKFSNEDYAMIVALPFSVGLAFLLIGSVIYYTTKKGIHVLLFFILSTLIAMFFFTHISTNFDHIFHRLWLLYPLFGAVGIHLFGIFPVEYEKHRLHTGVILSTYSISFILILLMQISFSHPQIFIMIFKVSTAFMGLAFLGLIYIFFERLVKTRSPVIRRKLRVLFFAIVSASSIAAIWSMIFPFTTPIIGIERGLLLSLLFPIITGYAVIKYNVFDIDRFVRTGLIFGLISVLLVSVYLTMIVITVLITEKLLNIETSVFNIAVATLAVAVLFHPVRAKVSELVSSTLYREELKFKNAIEKFFDTLPYFYHHTDLLRRVVKLFEGELGIYPVAIFVKEIGEGQFKDLTPFLNTISPTPSDNIREKINSSRAIITRKKVTILKEKTDDICESYLFREGYRIQIPFTGKEGILAIAFIGERNPGEMYSSEELKYLSEFAKRFSPVLENTLMYEEMMRKERLAIIGEMASIMIHEIKNPMGIIKAAVDTLERRSKYTDVRSEELFGIVRQEIERMDHTIRKILGYAKYEPPSLKEENIEEIVKEVESEYAEVFKEHKINFSLICKCESPFILLDREKIKSVFSNLISNAVDSIEENGKIEVEIKKEIENGEEMVLILVKDTGKGIPVGMEREIFKPFFSTKSGGTGLGLAVCERIIKDHGGTIEAFDRTEGGAIFQIKIPVRRG